MLLWLGVSFEEGSAIMDNAYTSEVAVIAGEDQVLTA